MPRPVLTRAPRRTRARTRSRAGLRAVALVLPLALVLGACSGDDEPAADPSPSPTGDTATEAQEEVVPSKHLLGQVVGRLPRKGRERLLRRVTPVVDQWLDEGFVAGTFPREVTGAWAGFTPGAARSARQERGLTSLAGLSERIDGVEVTRRAVRYVVLAPGGRAAGVTARITLDLHTSGEVETKVSVRGRLFLTPVRAGGRQEWKVFGYDLTRGRR
ncbi:hypothetical protein [Nocardioides campestrisoli]|uniref:hypothetical protein n=1 Tax=Nocardioides campestrisoli TaxID=2736757 RepID=UPI0015E7C0E5|nr:hypothetical protein [Nocardioides campestrisoli]